jgi:hypothetical protein
MCAVGVGARIHAAAPGSDVPASAAVRVKRMRREFMLLTTGTHRVRSLLALAARARSATRSVLKSRSETFEASQ